MTRTMLRAIAAAIVMAPLALQAQDQSIAVKGGGVQVPGWMGKVDAKEAAAGLTVDSARLWTMGQGMHVTTGPAITYWNPKMVGKGDYVVKATFSEREYAKLNSHPHPYGIVMAGNDLGSDNASYLYCAAYGDGRFIVRGFGPAPFQLNGRMGETNAAVHKAEGKGKPVSQEVAMAVKGDQVMCMINGTTVATYPKSAVVGAGKLKTTDGMVGFRFGHNTDAHIAGFSLGKP